MEEFFYFPEAENSWGIRVHVSRVTASYCYLALFHSGFCVQVRYTIINPLVWCVSYSCPNHTQISYRSFLSRLFWEHLFPLHSYFNELEPSIIYHFFYSPHRLLKPEAKTQYIKLAGFFLARQRTGQTGKTERRAFKVWKLINIVITDANWNMKCISTTLYICVCLHACLQAVYLTKYLPCVDICVYE